MKNKTKIKTNNETLFTYGKTGIYLKLGPDLRSKRKTLFYFPDNYKLHWVPVEFFYVTF
jgi:hypothetical protein